MISSAGPFRSGSGAGARVAAGVWFVGGRLWRSKGRAGSCHAGGDGAGTVRLLGWCRKAPMEGRCLAAKLKKKKKI